MNESSWEATRKAQRKKLYLLLVILFPILSLATIIVVNNRDQIAGNKQIHEQPHVVIPPKTVPTPDSLPKSQHDSLSKGASVPTATEKHTATVLKKTPQMVPPTPKVLKTAPLSVEPAFQKAKTVHEKMADTSKSIEKSSSIPHETPKNPARSLLSERLPPIKCSLRSRKDIVISLSLELFFRDEDHRTAIRLSRDEIKVMVMKSVLDKELSEMKIQALEKLLLQNVNSIFDHDNIKELKIKNIQVEKADQ